MHQLLCYDLDHTVRPEIMFYSAVKIPFPVTDEHRVAT